MQNPLVEHDAALNVPLGSVSPVLVQVSPVQIKMSLPRLVVACWPFTPAPASNAAQREGLAHETASNPLAAPAPSGLVGPDQLVPFHVEEMSPVACAPPTSIQKCALVQLSEVNELERGSGGAGDGAQRVPFHDAAAGWSRSEAAARQ